MHASLIFCSTSASINVQKIFKIVLAKAFDLKCVIPEIDNVGEPVLLYVCNVQNSPYNIVLTFVILQIDV